MTSKTITINLAEELKVKPRRALGFLTTPLGSLVKKNHLLAEKRGFLKKRRVFSPADGVLERVNEDTGELTMTIKTKVAGGVQPAFAPPAAGQRLAEKKTLNTSSSAPPRKFSNPAIVGFGRAEGELVDLGKQLSPEALKKEFSGKILVADNLPFAQAVFKANALGVVGIIVPRELTAEEIKVKDKIWGRVGVAFLAKKLDYKKYVGKKIKIDGEKGNIRISNVSPCGRSLEGR